MAISGNSESSMQMLSLAHSAFAVITAESMKVNKPILSETKHFSGNVLKQNRLKIV